MIEICVTVLIGLPGAGKTTFCKDLLRNCDSLNLIHICFDDYIEYNPNEGNYYKSQRKEIIKRTRNCLEFIQKEHKIPSEFDKCSKYIKDIQRYMILIDDNNYYRGMRYEFLQLARKSRTSFAQIYFDCSLEFAVKQNSLRKHGIIPYQVIENMNKRLEKPASFDWERNTLTIEMEENADYAKIYDFLTNCFQTVECEIKIDSKVPTCQSEIHKIDLELRKAIGSHLKSLKAHDNVPVVAQKLNEKRKSIIRDLKLEILQLPTKGDVTEIINLLEN